MIISKPPKKISHVNFPSMVEKIYHTFEMFQLFHMKVNPTSIGSTLYKRVNVLYQTHVIPPLKRISHDINCVLRIIFRPHGTLLCGDCEVKLNPLITI